MNKHKEFLKYIIQELESIEEDALDPSIMEKEIIAAEIEDLITEIRSNV